MCRKTTIACSSLVFLGLFIAGPVAASQVVAINSADFDRWNYAFNGTPGFRGAAPTFSAVGAGAFDNFDGQFLLGFDTAAAGVPALGPNEKYVIHAVTVSVTHSSGSFVYDPTFDSYATHLDAADPDFLPDDDAGRPIEIYGAGLRGGYSGFGFAGGITGPPTFNEGSPYAFADPTLPKVRNAFPFDPAFGDVANPVDDRLLTAAPWATAQAAGLNPGDLVPQGVPGLSAGQTFTFEIDLNRPGVGDYLTEGLEGGGLLFSVVSLHTTNQAGGSNPNFYTHDSFDPASVPPALTIDFDVVATPEPGTLTLGLIALCLLSIVARRSRPRRG